MPSTIGQICKEDLHPGLDCEPGMVGQLLAAIPSQRLPQLSRQRGHAPLERIGHGDAAICAKAACQCYGPLHLPGERCGCACSLLNGHERRNNLAHFFGGMVERKDAKLCSSAQMK